MSKIRIVINTTQHNLTPDQVEDLKKMYGEEVSIINWKDVLKPEVYQRIAVQKEPEDFKKAIETFAGIVAEVYWGIYPYGDVGFEEVAYLMPVGHPALYCSYEKIIKNHTYNKAPILYSVSERVSKEITEGGQVRKISIFKHKFFVEK